MHKHIIHSLAIINYPASPRRKSLPPSSHHYPGNIQRLFRLQTCFSRKSPMSWKYSKTFRHASIIPAATRNHPANSIPAATSNHPASSIPAATSNHPASSFLAATSNQQQKPTTATSNSNQQQQPATAINSSKQQQTTSIRPTSSTYTISAGDLLVITTVPSRRYPASSWPRFSCPVVECNHRTEAHFCYFFHFSEIPFVWFFLFC